MRSTFAPRLQELSFPAMGRGKKYDKPHMIIPDEDMAWALEQRSPVQKLWGECWRCDPYGSRWMPLQTNLGKENFKKAKKPLMDTGLFLFENRLSVVNGKRQYEWWVKNLHGCRSGYWKFQGIEISSDSEVENFNRPDTQTSIDFIQNAVNDLPAIDSTDIGIVSTTLNQQVGIDVTLPQTNSHDPSTDNTDPGISSPHLGTDNTDPGISSPHLGTDNTDPGTVNTTQHYLKSLAERVSKSLINSSETSHKHFINSLKIGEGGNFLVFCLNKIKVLRNKGFEVRTDDGWIVRHYEQYWQEYCNEKDIARKSNQKSKEEKKASLRDAYQKIRAEIEQRRIEVERFYEEQERQKNNPEEDLGDAA